MTPAILLFCLAHAHLNLCPPPEVLLSPWPPTAAGTPCLAECALPARPPIYYRVRR